MNIQKIEMPASPLPDMPLESSQIVEGSPVSKGTILMQSDDKKMSCGFWECTEGTFEWSYTWDEFVHILEGQVKVSEKDGDSSYTLNPGDTARFSPGFVAIWQVIKPVKKMFIVRTADPLE